MYKPNEMRFSFVIDRRDRQREKGREKHKDRTK